MVEIREQRNDSFILHNGEIVKMTWEGKAKDRESQRFMKVSRFSTCNLRINYSVISYYTGIWWRTDAKPSILKMDQE